MNYFYFSIVAAAFLLRGSVLSQTILPPVSQQDRQFGAVYEWHVIDFAFPNETARSSAIFSGDYIPPNNIISDIKAYANRLYLTLPRMLPGVPVTLAYVVSPRNNGKTNPELEPFPSWEMNQIGNCSAFQFVQGIAVDADGVMWVVDSGNVNTLIPEQSPPGCPPKLVLLDLKRRGQVIFSYNFPEEVVSRATNYLNKIVVDDADGGYAYITDNSGADPGMVVYSRRLNKSWKVREPNSMRSSSEAYALTMDNLFLNYSIHIDAIALGPYYTGLANERRVYYCPLSSYHLYSLPASVLRNPDLIARTDPLQMFQYVTDHGVKTSQVDAMTMDNLGILYYGLLNDNAIAQWDSSKPFTPENQHLIAHDKFHIHWTDGMDFDEEGYLYVVVNKFHRFITNKVDVNRINFRILQSKTGTLSYVHTGRRGRAPPGGGLFVPERAVTIIPNNGIDYYGQDYSTTPAPLTLTPTYSSSFFGSSTRLPYTSSANKRFTSPILLILLIKIII